MRDGQSGRSAKTGNWRNALRPNRREFVGGATAAGLVGAAGPLLKSNEAKGFAYEPYPKDDELTTVVTSCAHNCGSRHMLVAHKKGDVIVRLSTDDGRYQENGAFGKDTEAEPQVRACLRGPVLSRAALLAGAPALSDEARR